MKMGSPMKIVTMWNKKSCLRSSKKSITCAIVGETYKISSQTSLHGVALPRWSSLNSDKNVDSYIHF